MDLVCLSYCASFGEDDEADMFVTYLQHLGISSVHYGVKNITELDDIEISARVVVVFMEHDAPIWNDKAIFPSENGYKMVVYTRGKKECIHAIRSELTKDVGIYIHFHDLVRWAASFFVKRIPSKTEIYRTLTQLYKDCTDRERKKLRHALITVSYPNKIGHIRYFRPVRQVVDELIQLRNQENVVGIHIRDQCWNGKQKYTDYLMSLYQHMTSNHLYLLVSATFQATFTNKPLIQSICQIGLYRAYVNLNCDKGFVRGNRYRTADRAVKFWNDQHVSVVYQMFCFHPYVTKRALQKTLQLLRENNICNFHYYMTRCPLHSRLLARCRHSGLLDLSDFMMPGWRFDDSCIEKMYQYLAACLRSLSSQGYTEGIHESELLYYVRTFATIQEDHKLLNAVNEVITQFEQAKRKISEVTGAYFSTLLENCCWSDQKAHEAAIQLSVHKKLLAASASIISTQKSLLQWIYRNEFTSKKQLIYAL